MKTFNIMFNDLKPEVQKEFIEFIGDEIGNYDVFPIAQIDIDDDNDDKDR